MRHEMNLNPDAFDKIVSEKKVREYRLYDEKRRTISIGDYIEFFKLPNKKETVSVKVEGLLIYGNWHSCYEDFF